jgi:hypothetical protein
MPPDAFFSDYLRALLQVEGATDERRGTAAQQEAPKTPESAEAKRSFSYRRPTI